MNFFSYLRYEKKLRTAVKIGLHGYESNVPTFFPLFFSPLLICTVSEKKSGKKSRFSFSGFHFPVDIFRIFSLLVKKQGQKCRIKKVDYTV